MRTAVCSRVSVALAALLMAAACPAQAATLPAGFTESLVTNGLTAPTGMQFAPDGRLFVTEQGGQLRVIRNGTLLATPFLSVAADSTGERGLLGIAFDPAFASNHYLYIYYTATTPATHNRVSRFTADPTNPDVALAGSETPLLDLNNLSAATNHNGGTLNFGSDGKLYISAGENATSANAQSLNNLLGKILRINSDGSIPTDNPFYNTATGVNRAIWVLGLRNPFKFGVQPGTGRIFINDVGQSSWEEIDDGIAGSNYGWPTTEGPTTDPRFRGPLYAYDHSTGACAITGGAFYNPPAPPFPTAYSGDYFFADLCGGWIHRFHPADNSETDFATGISSPVDLKVGPNGNLYYLARGTNSISQIIYPGHWNCLDIATAPDNTSRLLWTTRDGRASVWSLDASGNQTSVGPSYGPYEGWTPQRLGVGADGRSRLLWTSGTGQESTWIIDANGIQATIAPTYGPYAGWTAIDLATAADNTSRILWRSDSGQLSLWTTDASGNRQTVGGAYGPYSGWLPQRVSVRNDGQSHVLWTSTNGQMSVWRLDAACTPQYIADTYGPYNGSAAIDIAPGANTTSHILWNTHGLASTWRVDGNGGAQTSSGTYGPFSNWSPLALAGGGDGNMRLLWTNGGQASIWVLDDAGNHLISPTFGPFGG